MGNLGQAQDLGEKDFRIRAAKALYTGVGESNGNSVVTIILETNPDHYWGVDFDAERAREIASQLNSLADDAERGVTGD